MKKRSVWAVAAAVAAALVLAGALIGRSGSQGIFYRVLGGKNEMVLLGSIHAGSREMYPMSENIRSALKAADVLVFECDTESPEALADMQRLMYYPQGESLKENVSEACWESVVLAAKQTGYDPALLNQIKPWAVVSMLSVESMADQTGSSARQAAGLGVEKQVKKQAGDQEIRYLETAEEQLLLMDGFSPALQEYLLVDACSAILQPEQEESGLKHWPGWWAQGDAQAFADAYEQEMAGEQEPALAREYHDALITHRNQRMAHTLQQMLESPQGGSFFVTVGLMHLVLEDDSILSELEAMGYNIEKI